MNTAHIASIEKAILACVGKLCARETMEEIEDAILLETGLIADASFQRDGTVTVHCCGLYFTMSPAAALKDVA